MTTKSLGTSLLLLALYATTSSAWEIVIPPQGTSRLTHYPTWRTPVPGDPQDLDMVTFFSVVGVLIGVGLVMRYEFMAGRPEIKTITDGYRSNSRLFSGVISFYLIATFFAVFGFWVLDLGKLWSVVGALHNLLEVSTLLVMTFSRRPEWFRYFYALLFFYYITTEWVCLVLPWPYDAIFFKFQGLSTDIALAINFYRLYHANKSDSAAGSSVFRSASRASGAKADPESAPLLKDNGQSYESIRHPSLSRLLHGHAHTSSSSSNPNVEIDAAAVAVADDQSTEQTASDLKIIIAASVIHILGNTIATISDQFFPFLVFQFSYGIAFPLYGYYVAKDPENSRLRWFDVSVVSESLVAIASIILGGLIVGIGAFLTLSRYQQP